jgi:WhiB family redox-sensing transcriptional regulator
MTPRDDHDPGPGDRAVCHTRPTFPSAMGKAIYRRLPPPVTEIWDWQLRAACRGLDGGVFVHPDRERGSARAAREMKAKQICRTCPVLQQCRRHALAVREPYGVWGGLSKPERDALLDRGHRPPLRLASPGSTARSGEPPPTPGPARTNHAGSVTQPAPDVMLHTGIAALAAHGRGVDLRLVPQTRDAVAGTPVSTAVPAALNLIRGRREEPQEYLTVAEVAAMLRVSRATIYRLVHAGRLPGMRVGRSVRVSRVAVERYLRDAALGGPQT